jgi:hypothetical protein
MEIMYLCEQKTGFADVERVEPGVVEPVSRGSSPRNYECDEHSDCM